jgi:hypothetical protein
MHGTDYDFHYSRYAALKAYIDRIGAEQRNFRHYQVVDHSHPSGYARSKADIRIEPDFSIRCNREEFKPTEAEAIKAELAT